MKQVNAFKSTVDTQVRIRNLQRKKQIKVGRSAKFITSLLLYCLMILSDECFVNCHVQDKVSLTMCSLFSQIPTPTDTTATTVCEEHDRHEDN